MVSVSEQDSTWETILKWKCRDIAVTLPEIMDAARVLSKQADVDLEEAERIILAAVSAIGESTPAAEAEADRLGIQWRTK